MRWLNPTNIHIALLSLVVAGLAIEIVRDSQGDSLDFTDPVSIRDTFRAPASLQPLVSVVETKKMTLPEPQVLSWNCDRKPLQVTADQIRWKISPCIKSKIKTLVEIRNETNSTTATIFMLPKGQIETDYMTMGPGINKISLVYKNAKGILETETLELKNTD